MLKSVMTPLSPPSEKPKGKRRHSSAVIIAQNFESEVLSAAVQTELSFVLAEKFDQQQLDKLCNYYNYSRQAGRTVIAPLEMFLQNAMIKFAEMSYNAGNKIDSANRLEFVEKLKLPHNQNFYLMQAKIYREVGDKEKALQTYQKALDAPI